MNCRAELGRGVRPGDRAGGTPWAHASRWHGEQGGAYAADGRRGSGSTARRWLAAQTRGREGSRAGGGLRGRLQPGAARAPEPGARSLEG